jgi:hypothetical protein
VLPLDRSIYVESRFFDTFDEIKMRKGDFVDAYLPNPDWHTSSWLNLNELREALAHAGLESEEQETAVQAVIAVMEALSESCRAEGVRLVFWFDG